MTKKLTVVQMLPELRGGGVERGTLEMAKYLVSQGHRSIVISGGGGMVEQLVCEGSEHIDLPVGKKSISTIRYISKVRKLLHHEQVDILHLRSRVPAWVGYLAWKKLPKDTRPKLVTTVHGFYSVGKYSSVMASGEKVIAVSDCIRKYILENYAFVQSKNVQVVYRGVDGEQYKFGYVPSQAWKNDWYAQFPQMVGKELLTLPARLTRLKGHADFITIIDTLVKAGENVHGVIVGGTHPKKEGYAHELQQQVTQLGLQSHITFVGHRTDVKEILALSTLVYSLSTSPESFGRTTLEALSMGKPVIGYSHGGVQEQLAKLFSDGLVPVGAIQDAIEKTKAFLEGTPTMQEQHTFTLDAMCSQTLALYQDLCKNGVQLQ